MSFFLIASTAAAGASSSPFSTFGSFFFVAANATEADDGRTGRTEVVVADAAGDGSTTKAVARRSGDTIRRVAAIARATKAVVNLVRSIFVMIEVRRGGECGRRGVEREGRDGMTSNNRHARYQSATLVGSRDRTGKKGTPTVLEALTVKRR